MKLGGSRSGRRSSNGDVASMIGHLGLQPQSVIEVGRSSNRPRTLRTPMRSSRMRSRCRTPAPSRSSSSRFPRKSPGTTSAALDIPTIGIGAGPHCDGQVLITSTTCSDCSTGFVPSFVKQYASLAERSRSRRERIGTTLRRVVTAFVVEDLRVPDGATRWRWRSSRRSTPTWRRGSRRDAPRFCSGSCPRWARCTRDTQTSFARRAPVRAAVVVSIFVDPIQFDRRDLERYPAIARRRCSPVLCAWRGLRVCAVCRRVAAGLT